MGVHRWGGERTSCRKRSTRRRGALAHILSSQPADDLAPYRSSTPTGHQPYRLAQSKCVSHWLSVHRNSLRAMGRRISPTSRPAATPIRNRPSSLKGTATRTNLASSKTDHGRCVASDAGSTNQQSIERNLQNSWVCMVNVARVASFEQGEDAVGSNVLFEAQGVEPFNTPFARWSKAPHHL